MVTAMATIANRFEANSSRCVFAIIWSASFDSIIERVASL